jgi:hypothetical protein
LTQYQRDAAQQIVTQANAELESILRIYYLRHSFEAYDSTLTIFLAHLANLTLEPLKQLEQDPTSVPSETSKSLLSTLILCFHGLYEQSKSAYVAGIMLTILKKRLSVDARNTVGRHVAIEEPDSDTDSIDEMNAEYSQILSELVLPGASLSDDPKRWRLKNLMDEPRRGSG